MKKNKKDSFSKKVKVTKLTREDGQSEKLEEKRINVKKGSTREPFVEIWVST